MNAFLSNNTGSEQSWKQADAWITNCLQNHPNCRVRRNQISKENWPARLLDVGNGNTLFIKPFCPAATELPKYMTLSHCWGGVVSKRLLKENQAAFIGTGIPLEELPKTFRDAVGVTRKLGVKFLWIDSLCIIQDSSDDWDLESSKMCHIYENSYLNLAAGASPDSNGGLFNARSPTSILPCQAQVGEGTNTKVAISDYKCNKEELVLFTRGWVLQERILARRTLVFGKFELYWECLTLEASEAFPWSEPVQGLPSDNGELISLRRILLNGGIAEQQLLMAWSTAIEEYSGKKLTHFSDKMVAISGLASKLGSFFGEMSYHAGHWSYHFPASLLWHSDPSIRPRSYIPSWSWASIEGPVHVRMHSRLSESSDKHLPEKDQSDLPYKEDLVKVCEVDVQHLTPSVSYGSVTKGVVRLEGPLIRAKLIQKNTTSESLSDRKWEISLRDPTVTSIIDRELADRKIKSLLDWEIPTSIQWDGQDMNEMVVGSAHVYLASIQIHLCQHVRLQLVGLVLLPTYIENGQFRRVGTFTIESSWLGNIIERSLSLVLQRATPTTPSESESSSENSSIEGDLSEDSADEVSAFDRGICKVLVKNRPLNLEIANLIAPIEEHADVEDETSRRLKKMMHDIKEGVVSQAEHIIPGNRYSDGKFLNTLLTGRYYPVLTHYDYPEIDSFLGLSTLLSLERNRYAASIKYTTGIAHERQGTFCGNGRYRYDII